jgi:hypothetical protein
MFRVSPDVLVVIKRSIERQVNRQRVAPWGSSPATPKIVSNVNR